MISLTGNGSETKPLNLLLVEDDDGDAKAVERAFRSVKVVNAITRAVDGIEALDLLRGENGATKIASPYMLLVDLNMPRMGGLEFLAEVREDEELANSVIFVLTTSDAPSDIAKAYEQKIAGYIIKENAYDTVKAAMEMLGAFVEIVSLEGRPQLQAAAQ